MCSCTEQIHLPVLLAHLRARKPRGSAMLRLGRLLTGKSRRHDSAMDAAQCHPADVLSHWVECQASARCELPSTLNTRVHVYLLPISAISRRGPSSGLIISESTPTTRSTHATSSSVERNQCIAPTTTVISSVKAYYPHHLLLQHFTFRDSRHHAQLIAHWRLAVWQHEHQMNSLIPSKRLRKHFGRRATRSRNL